MYSTILVPIDLSHPEFADRLVDAAKQLANQGNKVVCMHVVQELPTYVLAELPPDLIDSSDAKATAALEKLVAERAVQASVEVRSGQPAQIILDTAEKLEADLIIIGSHRPGLYDFLLGSTAARVVRHAECDVLVKRPPIR